MKSLILCAAALIAAGLLGWLPATEKDVGDLLPVQTLVASREGDLLRLDGGEGLRGTGKTWAEAMEDLRAAAPGEAFFGAAGQIVLVEEAREAMTDMLADRNLRPAARVYAGRGAVDSENAAAYLNAHEGGVTLQMLQAAVLEGRDETLPVLVCEDGRYQLEDG